MSFQPVVPFGGYAGWQFLTKTMAAQKAAFDNSTVQQRDADYFTANIGKVTSADQLVADPKLLKVALGAFGLGDQANSTYLIKQVLTQGSNNSTALANQLTDKRYLALARAFNFGDTTTPKTQSAGFAAQIVSAYQNQQFGAAIGTQDSNLQLALSMQTDLANLASTGSSETTKWYLMMGNPSMRTVFETAMGLPTSFVSLNLDQQLTVFQDKAQQMFGDSSVSQFSDPTKVDQLVKDFLVRNGDTSASQSSAGSIALALLGGSTASNINAANSTGIAALFT